MNFFDDLKEELSREGKKAATKAKNMFAISKLNSSIEEQEKKLGQVYQQIGKKYVELYGEKQESEFAEMLTMVQECNLKMTEYKKEIEAIKSTEMSLEEEKDAHILLEERKRVCKNCNTELSPNALYCPECGTKVEEQNQ